MTQIGAWVVVAANLLGGWLQQCRDPKVLDWRLERLLARYVAYRLPLPPADAPLVRCRWQPIQKGEPGGVSLAFQVAVAKGDEPGRLLDGPIESPLDPDHATVEAVLPDPELVGERTGLHWGFAVQCKARGWDALARVALVRAMENHPRWVPESEVHSQGWIRWTDEILKPGTDRALIARHLRLVLSTRPAPAKPHERELIRSLELALVPSKAKPGSVEALIDELIDVCDSGLGWGTPTDPRYMRLALRGFEAAPALIAHLSDDRLTRAKIPLLNNFPIYHLRVGHVVSLLLRGLSGEDLGASRVDLRLGYRVDPAEAEKWWLGARRIGEEEYLTRGVLTGDRDAEWLNRLQLDVLAAKYPARLPGVYRQLLAERPKMAGWPVAEAVERSSLPNETKRQVLLEATKQKAWNHRADGIAGLRSLDAALSDRLLIEALRALPETPEGAYWLCPEGRLASCVWRSTNAVVWEALGATARRVDPGFRLELLDFHGSPETRQGQALYLRYLAAFLADETVRDKSTAPKKFDSCAASEFDRIRVGDFVAMRIGSVLKLKAEPDPAWTPAGWERYRAEVRAALEHEGVK